MHVISYKGKNYYQSCDEFVADRPKGGQTYCVKRIGHPGNIHEDWDGLVRSEEPIVTYDVERDLANAIRLTVEYVGNDMLPAQEGWSWFDALNRYNPEMARKFVECPIHFITPTVDVVVEPILFRNDGQNPETLSEVIGVGAGAISACWENLAGAGIFESTRAKTIVDEMMTWIQAHYVPMSTYKDGVTINSFKRQKVRLITDKNDGQPHPQDSSGDPFGIMEDD